MTVDIVRHRVHTQLLSQTEYTQPEEVVAWLGAVQAQDYAGAKWGLGQRLRNATDAALDQAFNEGKILRTHVMRPTWHFVTPADIRWILALTAPRVHAANAFMYRKLELDRAILKRSNAAIEKALRDGKQMTRSEFASIFQRTGIDADGLRGGYLMSYAELEGLICSGARRGKQMTYALLEERAPQARVLTREEALAELTRRYFATRGPATLQDYTWWSGLTMADAKKGIELVKPQFENETIGGKTYWFASSVSLIREKSPTAHLLPNYDEYFIGFKDRSAIGEVVKQAGIKGDDPSFLAHIIILDGQVIGGWRRTIKKDAVTIELNLITKLTKAENGAVSAAIEQYARFLGLPAELASVN